MKIFSVEIETYSAGILKLIGEDQGAQHPIEGRSCKPMASQAEDAP